jgi:hypothetical protein
MQRKPLGSTGLMLSPFGLCWGAAGVAAAARSEPPQASNWCDVSADLPPAMWERLRPLLPSEGFIVQARVGPGAWDERMLAACEELCARIGCPAVDLWQLAGFDLERIKGGQPFAMLRRLRDAGRVRFFSLRVTGLEDALWSLERTPVHSLTVDAPLEEQAWPELLQAADDAGVAIIATADCVNGDGRRAETLLQNTTLTSFSWPVRLW